MIQRMIQQFVRPAACVAAALITASSLAGCTVNAGSRFFSQSTVSNTTGYIERGVSVGPYQLGETANLTPYWLWMNIPSQENHFAVKYSWKRPDQLERGATTTGGYVEFLMTADGEIDQTPESVTAEVADPEAGTSKPARVTRLPVQADRYLIEQVALPTNRPLELRITASFGGQEDTAVIRYTNATEL